MHGNVARPLYLEDEVIEKNPMEPNIGVIENEIAHLGSDVNELKDGMKTVNTILGGLTVGQTRLEGQINTVRAEMGALGEQIDKRIAILETKIIKWVIGTGISCGGLAFTFAKFFK